MPISCARHHKIQVNPGSSGLSVRLLLVWLLAWGHASAQQTGTSGPPVGGRVRLAVTVSPDVAGLEESAPILLTLTSQDPSSDAQLLPGDVFRLVFDLGNGRIESLGRAAIATSNTIDGSDFLIGMGSGAAEILLTYTGPAAQFGSKDSIAVLAVVKTPTTARTNK